MRSGLGKDSTSRYLRQLTTLSLRSGYFEYTIPMGFREGGGGLKTLTFPQRFMHLASVAVTLFVSHEVSFP